MSSEEAREAEARHEARQETERTEQTKNDKQALERPTLRKLGTLPHVTTAFGGSFSP